MSHTDARRWNERYAQEKDRWLEHEPRRLLVEYAHLLPASGLALDAASGVGINSLFVARRGLRVIALDISEIALRLAVRQARSEGLPVSAAVYDLSTPWLPEAVFDVILNFHFLERATLPVFRRALKPGGLLFFETFVKTGGEIEQPDYYLDPGELQAAYRGFEILHYEEMRLPATETHSERGLAQLVARKPG